ncbi:response regulator [Reyranella sp.]|uniref:response regulator n=1 Tax=Reyranella sp. TaxID=1929291 RepID=UPI003D0C1D4C
MLGEASSGLKDRPRCVLIVEDDDLLGIAIGLCVEDAGYEVAGLARSVEAALETLDRETVDAALLDINLQGELVFPVANALAERGVPFVFVTAHPPRDIPEKHRHRPVVPKPYYDAAICAALESVLSLKS